MSREDQEGEEQLAHYLLPGFGRMGMDANDVLELAGLEPKLPNVPSVEDVPQEPRESREHNSLGAVVLGPIGRAPLEVSSPAEMPADYWYQIDT